MNAIVGGVIHLTSIDDPTRKDVDSFISMVRAEVYRAVQASYEEGYADGEQDAKVEAELLS